MGSYIVFSAFSNNGVSKISCPFCQMITFFGSFLEACLHFCSVILGRFI